MFNTPLTQHKSIYNVKHSAAAYPGGIYSISQTAAFFLRTATVARQTISLPARNCECRR